MTRGIGPMVSPRTAEEEIARYCSYLYGFLTGRPETLESVHVVPQEQSEIAAVNVICFGPERVHGGMWEHTDTVWMASGIPMLYDPHLRASGVMHSLFEELYGVN